MDLVPNFKVSADSFQMQVRSSFPERIGGVAVFGSNDKENWTRLTPDTTTVSEDMQTLEVADDLKNEPFRFLKIQMIEDRKSTRLNSSHVAISYAVFCLKKKTID